MCDVHHDLSETTQETLLPQAAEKAQKKPEKITTNRYDKPARQSILARRHLFFWHTVPIPQFSTIYECTDGAAGLLKDLQKADAGASDR